MSAFVVASCDGAEIFQSVNCALDDIAAFVSLCVKARRRATSTSLAQTALPRILTFRANASNASGLDLLPIMPSTISAIDAYARRPFPGATTARTRHINRIEQRSDMGRVATLAGRDKNGQRQTVPIDTDMDFAGDTPA